MTGEKNGESAWKEIPWKKWKDGMEGLEGMEDKSKDVMYSVSGLVAAPVTGLYVRSTVEMMGRATELHRSTFILGGRRRPAWMSSRLYSTLPSFPSSPIPIRFHFLSRFFAEDSFLYFLMFFFPQTNTQLTPLLMCIILDIDSVLSSRPLSIVRLLST